jgi:hypothetical protein
MARNRNRNDFDDQPTLQAGLVELPHEEAPADEPDGDQDDSPEVDREKAALAARVAELEAVLADMADRLEGAEAEEEPKPRSRYWKVQLQHAPTHVVEARDAANAWEQYRREMGVIGSEFAPEATPAGREEYRAAQARRFGMRPDEYRLPDDE